MKTEQRVAHLFEEAVKLGCDTPTEAMVFDAMHDLEAQTISDIAAEFTVRGMTEAVRIVNLFHKKRFNSPS